MSRLELDVVQKSSGNALEEAAKATENLHQATSKLKAAQDSEAAAARKVEIAQQKLAEVKRTAKDGSSQLLAAEDRLATAMSKLNTATAKTGSAMGDLNFAQKAAAGSAGSAATAVGKVDKAAAKSGGGMSSLTGMVGKFAGALGIAGIVDKAVSKVVEFGVGSITAASDLQQASGAAEAVFGKDYASISAAAGKAATAVGLSSAEYQQMAAVMGAGLKNQGLDDYANKTQKVIGLGADLAAQFGGSTADAVEAIGSLMRGETDPIEKYGVSINQSAVSAELAARGQSKLTGAALKQAEAQAKLDLLTRQTTQAQGTFARESDTLAGSQQRLSAQTQDLQAKIGTALLPALSGVTSYLSQTMQGGTGLSTALKGIGDVIVAFVTPIIEKVKVGFKNFKDSIDRVTGGSEQTQVMLTKVGEVVGKVAGFIGDLVGNQLALFWTGLGKIIEASKLIVDWVGRMSDKIGAITLPFGLGKISDVFAAIADKVELAVKWIGRFYESGQSGALAGAAGLFRSEVLFGGGSTGASMVPLLVPAPVTNVSVNVDGASLRGIIRAEIRATLRSGGDVR